MQAHEPEWLTRKERIDPKLDAAGWVTSPVSAGRRSEEEATANGPADYVLWLDGHPVAVIEAKKLTIGPQNVLTQAERYAEGLGGTPYNFHGFHVPFLYATNGEVIWFHDVRNPLNRSRQIAAFHTPAALRELLARDLDSAHIRLAALPNDSPKLRPYQRDANAAVEKAIGEKKRHLLVAMATGTGKTYTLVNQIFRLMRSGIARRVLFLVDRRALAAQAVRAFAAFDTAPGLKFDKEYEVYSSRFQLGEADPDEPFDPKVMPNSYLTSPQPAHAFVYVCTIQRMAINILGRQAIFGIGDETVEEDASKLDIPIHAFDVIVADECHRGYTAQEQSVWRTTLDHFDAVKIGLTATPAAHTAAYFQNLVFRYEYARAVADGYLVDYDVVNIRSEVRLNGVFLHEGEQVEIVDPESGQKKLDLLEDERSFETTEIERKITSPDSNRKILDEVRTYALAHETRYGRLPKTLIFAVNDLPHTSHADQLVNTARDVFGRGESFVEKITGRVDRPLQRIREFRNRTNPGIAVTVDLLSTGVDIPDLEFIVFLRPVKSRILFEQMLGRGTRKGEKFSDKSHFTVFDGFDGSLLEYFRAATGITSDPPDKPSKSIVEVIEAIWKNEDRAYNTRCLVKRLQRIDKDMSGEGRTLFAAFIPDGDLAGYARMLGKEIQEDFVAVMKLLRDPAFQGLLENYPRSRRVFLVANETVDTVSSRWLIRDGAGKEYRPEDYLEAFARFVRENPAHIDAIRILLGRPVDWSTAALGELRQKLAASPFRFQEDTLRKVHEFRYKKALVDIISMVKHAVDEQNPLLTAAERVEAAFHRLTVRKTFSPEQQEWLDRIKRHLRENLSIDQEDFDLVPVLANHGGWGAARRVFPDLPALLRELNEAIAA